MPLLAVLSNAKELRIAKRRGEGRRRGAPRALGRSWVEEKIAPASAFDPRSFRYKKSGRAYVLIGCPKGKWAARKGRCKVGTRAHVVLKPRAAVIRKVAANPTAQARFGPCPKGKVRSRRGKCVRPIGYRAKKGKLYGWHTGLPAARRHQILAKVVRMDGYATVVRRLNFLVNISADQKTRMVARTDMAWMKRNEAALKAGRRVAANHPLLMGAAAGAASALAHQAVSRAVANPRQEREITVPFKTGRKYRVEQVDRWVRQNGTPQMVKRWEMALNQYRKFHLGSNPNYISYGVQNIGAHKGIVDVEFGVSEGKEWMASYQVPKTSRKYQDPSSDGRYVHAHGESNIDVDVRRPVKKKKLPERFHTPDGKFVGVIPSKNVKITDWYRG